jgi:Mg2+ and Co2+ transporter CorA
MALDSTAPRLRVPLDWQLPPAVARRLGERSGRQRAMSADGHLLLVLHEPPVPGNSQRAGRLFWRDPTGNWRSSSHGAGVQSLMGHLTEFAERVERLEKDLENADTAGEYYALLRAVAPLHRSARNLQATLQRARELVPADTDLINARDQSADIERALELIHNDASHGLDFTIARHAEHQAEATHQMSVAGYRLNLLAAAFFPLATIGTIFGMNLTHGLEGPNYSGVFWALLMLGLMCGIVLAVIIARKPVKPAAMLARKRPPPFRSGSR